MTPPDAYPLSWPVHVPRTRLPRVSAFGKHTIGDARDVLLRELKLLGAGRVVISSNLRLRLDGLPISAQAQPHDVGVAVYFRLGDADICLPCDRWNKVEHNLWAVASDIEAQRGRRRWGVGSVEQAFAGYAALPASTAENCWEVLLIRPHSPPDVILRAYRELALTRHPDRGGSHEQMTALNRARTEALAAHKGGASRG